MKTIITILFVIAAQLAHAEAYVDVGAGRSAKSSAVRLAMGMDINPNIGMEFAYVGSNSNIDGMQFGIKLHPFDSSLKPYLSLGMYEYTYHKNIRSGGNGFSNKNSGVISAVSAAGGYHPVIGTGMRMGNFIVDASYYGRIYPSDTGKSNMIVVSMSYRIDLQ